MTELDKGQILERLQKLERQNRKMKMAGITAVLLLAIGFLGWSMLDDVQYIEATEPNKVHEKKVVEAPPKSVSQILEEWLWWLSATSNKNEKKVIEAEEFVLLDAKGNRRLVMAVIENEPSIGMYDAKGKVRFIMRLLENGPAITLCGEDEETGLTMTVIKDTPAISLWDENGKNRLGMRLLKGKPCIEFSDMNEKVRAKFGFFNEYPEDFPGIWMYDPKGKERLAMGVLGDLPGIWMNDANEKRQVLLMGTDLDFNGGYMSIFNKTGEEVITLQADEYGNGEIGAWNRKGKGRTLQPGP